MEIQLADVWRQLLAVPGVTDVVINGSAHTYIDVGSGLERAANPFASDDELMAALIELGFQTGNRVDASRPISDFTISGARFHAVLPFGVSNKPLVSIRVHPSNQVTLANLLEVGMLDPKQLDYLLGAIEDGKNILISGPTSSGKTTLLTALLEKVSERVICIEQIPELVIHQPAISLTERVANQEGAGAISMQQLIVEALRMRPDRIVVGEIRGAEFGVLLQAMNNGHRGTLSTLHSFSLDRVPQRLTMLGLLSGFSVEVAQTMVANTFDLVLQLGRVSGSRKLIEIGQFTGCGFELERVQL